MRYLYGSLSSGIASLSDLMRFLLVLATVVVVLLAVRRLLEGRVERAARFRIPLVMLGLSFVGLLAIVTFLPIAEPLRIQLIQLIGIVLSASIALASTTFLGNAMAGVMLRFVGGFHTGDYVRIGEHAGMVSERGLFHTEIQTEDRDLTTLPNLFMVSNPVKVAKSSGTIISAQISLGYDVPRGRVKELLTAACEGAGLGKPFVQIVDLGDFSVLYRVSGLLEDLEQLIRARSRLRGAVLDELHGAGVEIVSPNFMNTRAVGDGRRFLPPAEPTIGAPEIAAARAPEQVVFEKAKKAAELDDLERRQAELEKAIKTATDDERTELERELAAALSELERHQSQADPP